MLKKPVNLLIIFLAALTALAITSYAAFTFYKPGLIKPGKQLKSFEVKSLAEKIPLPKSLKEIGQDEYDGGLQKRFETTDEPEKIQAFYQNFLLSNDWEQVDASETSNSSTAKYNKENKTISINTATSELSKNTIVSIDVAEKIN